MRRPRFVENHRVTLDVSFSLIFHLGFLICHLLHPHPVTLLKVKGSLHKTKLS